jgi:protein-L-isoaspartate(D-aspartate) O-methyltransferase
LMTLSCTYSFQHGRSIAIVTFGLISASALFPGCAEPSSSSFPQEPSLSPPDDSGNENWRRQIPSERFSSRAEEDSSELHSLFQAQRKDMVEFQLRQRGISDVRVLEAMQRVPRHRFVPAELVDSAYEDRPLPIGHGQTISQPYIVALMTEAVRPRAEHRGLEVGTGCGYQAAVLAELVDHVYSIDIVEPLAKESAIRLAELGFNNVTVKAGDGYRGWKEHSPFDIIIVAAAPDHVPQPLVEQLAVGGRMVIPVGREQQDLLLWEKQDDGSIKESRIAAVRFVPMTGEAEMP